jgi:hypothetical protein
MLQRRAALFGDRRERDFLEHVALPASPVLRGPRSAIAISAFFQNNFAVTLVNRHRDQALSHGPLMQ